MPRRITAASESKKLRDRFLRDLEREGERIVKQLSQQLLKDLEAQSGQLLQQLTGSFPQAGGLGITDGASILTRVFGSALGFALSRPHTTRNIKETARSREVEQQFRLSRRQVLAEAGIELTRGDKNL